MESWVLRLERAEWTEEELAGTTGNTKSQSCTQGVARTLHRTYDGTYWMLQIMLVPSRRQQTWSRRGKELDNSSLTCPGRAGQQQRPSVLNIALALFKPSRVRCCIVIMVGMSIKTYSRVRLTSSASRVKPGKFELIQHLTFVPFFLIEGDI